MIKYVFELEFSSTSDKSIVIKIPRANMEISNADLIKAMQDIVDTQIVSYSSYQPNFVKGATLVKTNTHEYDLN